jgi:signal recognition particle subunit SRP54
MTGQDAVNVANSFNDQIGIDGVILTKLDGDTRGGAALSIRAVTGKPILFIGMGEKLDDLEQFYPDRMASRILGMGDIESLIEKAQNAIDEDTAAQLEEKMKSKQGFGFDDYLIAMEQMNQMGGIASMLSMMPGMGSQLKGVDVDDSVMDRPKAIILSMTPQERANPDIISPSRKRRIAKGAGVDVAEVNRMMKQFEQTKKMMKSMGLMGNGKGSKKKRRGGMMPGLGGMPGMGGFPGLGGGKKFPF